MQSEMKERILFVAPAMRTFIRNDIDELSKSFDVRVNIYSWNKKGWTLWYMFRQFFVLLSNIFSVHAIIVSFGGYWAFMPALMGRITGVPVYIIVHGADCASIPSINYGMLRKPLLRKICGWSYQLADGLFPVSDSLMSMENNYFSSPKEQEFSQGIFHFFPKLKTSYRTIFNGLNPDFWTIESRSAQKKGEAFITVISNIDQMRRKGIYDILQLAEDFKENKFYIVGAEYPSDKPPLPENVQFLGRLTPEELRSWYHRSTFYLQLSLFEGFGYALAESMLCGCIPIGSSVNMIPEIIGPGGFIVKRHNPEEIKQTIQTALQSTQKEELSQIARAHIIENFQLEKRGLLLSQYILSGLDKDIEHYSDIQ